jgi:ligand-binding sensor domain-containing protein/HPt (histidine-containing phosphotransfer) domain-containing protein
MKLRDKNKKMKLPFYLVVILWLTVAFILSSSTYSQISKIQFERISIESGLSQSSVLCIYQDHNGFLWFGTYEGLNRYDGYNFKVYKADPKNPYSLRSNNIECIIEDHSGMLWIGTEEGLTRFDRNTEKFYNYKNNPREPNSLSHNYVRYVYEDRSGVLWIGTQGGGLNRFDREKEIFIHYSHDPNNTKSLAHNNVLSILEDDQGNLWIGTDGGLNCFDKTKGEFIRYQNDPNDPYSLSHNSVWRIYKDRKGNIWIGTWGGGLNLFNHQNKRFFRYQNNPKDPHSLSNNVIRSLCEDREGNLWIGTDGGGLNILSQRSKDKDKNHFIHYETDRNDPNSLSSNSVISILEDQSGILWVGTNFGGINKINPSKRKFVHYKSNPNDINSLNNNSIFALFEDSRRMIWIGTNGGGLNQFNRGTNQFTHYIHNPRVLNSLSNNVIRSICEDSLGRIWIGTDNGLNRFDPVLNNFTRYEPDPVNPASISHHDVSSLFKDASGNIWAGTMNGLNRFDYEKEEFIRYMHDKNDSSSISDNFVWSIYEDQLGIFWIGTNRGGLNRFDPGKGTFVHYKYNIENSGGISDNKVLCILEDHTGVLWIGTPNGLNKLDRDKGTFHHYYEKDGLPSNSIQGMLEDEQGNLWISTNNGLSKFTPRTNRFKNYSVNYGLQSNEFGVNACYKLKSGEMIFGGINGFNIFHPDSIKDNTDIPPVWITDFEIFNKPVAVGEKHGGRVILKKSISQSEEITLSYKDDVFTFEFAALHYASPNDNLYAYIMDGFDKQWIHTNAHRRYATYTNLPGGNYTFRVRGSNNDGVWNPEGTSIHIIITPPFWQTWWFRIFIILFITGLAFTIHKRRIQKIETHRRELEIKVEERTHELKQANREIAKKANELHKSKLKLEIAKKETDNILQNVKEGFFLLDNEYIISSQYSLALEYIFSQKKLAQLNLIDFLVNKIPESEIENTKMYLDLLFNDTIDENSIRHLNPLIELEFILEENGSRSSKYLTFEFSRIKPDKSKKSELIVTVRDITRQVLLSKKLKEEEARREKLLQLILGILDVEPEMLNDFRESAKRELEFINKIMNHSKIEDYHDLLVKVFRAIHLIKGNAKLLNIDYFAQAAHQFEDLISEVQNKTKIAHKDIEPLRVKLRELETGIEEMEKIIEKIGQVLTHKVGKKRSDARSLLLSLENLIKSFSSDLGKKIKFDYKKFQSQIIPTRYHLLVKEVLIQLIRNSISHGIEFPEERKRLKKPQYGKIEISTFKKNGSIGFRLRDDGRGIQVKKLKEKALQSGRWDKEEIEKWDDNKIAELIFTSGISTAERVDMIAGRGVGMDGVIHRLKEYSGEIQVHFTEGQYCEFEVILPVIL